MTTTPARPLLFPMVLLSIVLSVPIVVFAAGSGGGGSSGSGTGRTDLNTFGCTQDVWECGTWEETCGLDGVQSRSCVMSLDCPNAATPPKPSETRSCATECTADQWACGAWGSCINRVQQRVCTKSSECPFMETPSPATSAKCSVDCGLDQWTCSAWSACVSGSRSRTCALRENCEDRGVAKPAEREACTASAPVPSPAPKKPVRTPSQPAAPPVVPAPVEPTVVCANLRTLAERVTCRLGLSSEALERELALQYLPEECRAIQEAGGADATGDTNRCIERYRNLRPCWTKPIGSERLACVREVLQLPHDLRSACRVDSAGAAYDARQSASCRRYSAYPYITFRFYDLEERAESLLKIGAPMDLVTTFVAQAEQAKIDFSVARVTDERIAIIRRVQQAWRSFVATLPVGVVERARQEGVGSSYE